MTALSLRTQSGSSPPITMSWQHPSYVVCSDDSDNCEVALQLQAIPNSIN